MMESAMSDQNPRFIYVGSKSIELEKIKGFKYFNGKIHKPNVFKIYFEPPIGYYHLNRDDRVIEERNYNLEVVDPEEMITILNYFFNYDIISRIDKEKIVKQIDEDFYDEDEDADETMSDPVG